jgi:hypothetical protein
MIEQTVTPHRDGNLKLPPLLSHRTRNDLLSARKEVFARVRKALKEVGPAAKQELGPADLIIDLTRGVLLPGFPTPEGKVLEKPLYLGGGRNLKGVASFTLHKTARGKARFSFNLVTKEGERISRKIARDKNGSYKRIASKPSGKEKELSTKQILEAITTMRARGTEEAAITVRTVSKELSVQPSALSRYLPHVPSLRITREKVLLAAQEAKEENLNIPPSANEVCERIGVSPQSFSNWLRNEREAKNGTTYSRLGIRPSSGGKFGVQRRWIESLVSERRSSARTKLLIGSALLLFRGGLVDRDQVRFLLRFSRCRSGDPELVDVPLNNRFGYDESTLDKITTETRRRDRGRPGIDEELNRKLNEILGNPETEKERETSKLFHDVAIRYARHHSCSVLLQGKEPLCDELVSKVLDSLDSFPTKRTKIIHGLTPKDRQLARYLIHMSDTEQTPTLASTALVLGVSKKSVWGLLWGSEDRPGLALKLDRTGESHQSSIVASDVLKWIWDGERVDSVERDHLQHLVNKSPNAYPPYLGETARKVLYAMAESRRDGVLASVEEVAGRAGKSISATQHLYMGEPKIPSVASRADIHYATGDFPELREAAMTLEVARVKASVRPTEFLKKWKPLHGSDSALGETLMDRVTCLASTLDTADNLWVKMKTDALATEFSVVPSDEQKKRILRNVYSGEYSTWKEALADVPAIVERPHLIPTTDPSVFARFFQGVKASTAVTDSGAIARFQKSLSDDTALSRALQSESDESLKDLLSNRERDAKFQESLSLARVILEAPPMEEDYWTVSEQALNLMAT